MSPTGTSMGGAASASALLATLAEDDAAKAKAKKSKASSQGSSKVNTVVALSGLLRQLESDIKTLEASDNQDQEVLDGLKESQSRLQKELEVLTSRLDNLVQDQNTRLSQLEKLQIHGDASFGLMHDMGNGRNGRQGIEDSTTAAGRLRLTIDVPVVEAKEDSKIGAGTLSARIIGAFGRYGPAASKGSSTFGNNYAFNAYSRVAADISAYNEGFGTGAAGNPGVNGQNGFTSYLRPNIFLESLFYKQNLRSGIPVLTDWPGRKLLFKDKPDFKATADFSAGLIRWWDWFDVSPYRGDEQSQFQNGAFINIPGIAVNYAQPMAVYSLHQALGKSASLDVTTGVGSVDVGDLADTLNTTYEAKLNYLPRFLPEALQKPGSLYVGGYNVFLSGNRNFNKIVGKNYTTRNGQAFDPSFGQQTINSFYAGWNQEWWRGIGTNVGFVMNTNSPTTVMLTSQQPGPAGSSLGAKSAFTSVVNIPMSAFGLKKRGGDSLGLGYAWTNVTDGLPNVGNYAHMEHVAEVFYRMKLTENFSIIPSAQLIMNPTGSNLNAPITVLGLRASYRF
jgi:hypothetical protein